MKNTRLVCVMLGSLMLLADGSAADYGSAGVPAGIGATRSDLQGRAVTPAMPAAPTPTPVAPAASPVLDQTMFDQLDTNKDSSIVAVEAEKSATAKARFHELDTNRDGRISREEWKAGAATPR